MAEPARVAVYGASIGGPGNPIAPITQIEKAKEAGFPGLQLNIHPSHIEGKSDAWLKSMVDNVRAASEEHGVYIVGVSSGSPGPWIFESDKPGYDNARKIAAENTGFIDVTEHPIPGEELPDSWRYEGKVNTGERIMRVGALIDQGRVFCAHAGHLLDLSDPDAEYSPKERANYEMILKALNRFADVGDETGMYFGGETGPDSVRAIVGTAETVDEGRSERRIYSQLDTGNERIWENPTDYYSMGKILVNAGRLISVHLKGEAAPEGEVPEGAWQAREVTLYDGANRVDIPRVLDLVKDVTTPYGHPVPVTVELEVEGNLEERCARLAETRKFLEGPLRDVGGFL